jgi:NAD(P)H-dependent FMN reductase
MVKLLFLAGSTRKDSINRKLADCAQRIAGDMEAEVTLIDLVDYEMPLYNGDLESESGIPDAAIALKKLFVSHDGVFIASPEYNGSFSPVLLNSLDWISRPHTKDEESLQAFKGTIFALGSAAPGNLGGLRGLVPLRMLLGNVGGVVIPSQVAISKGFEAFDGENNLKNEPQASMLKGVIEQFIQMASLLSRV